MIEIIQSTLSEAHFDTSCKRMATGLFQDMFNNMQESIVNYLDICVNILFVILNKCDLSPDVKVTAIQAIGELCLVSEVYFLPKLNETMKLLIEAGQCCL
jgi:hypothetical protein